MAKTKTSTEVKRRYNEKVYKKLSFQLPNDTVDQFKEKCEALGIPQRQVIMQLIIDFIEEK